MAAFSLPTLTSLASALLSWRTLALTLVLLNLKNVPLAWHFRLLYQLLRHRHTPAAVRRSLHDAAHSTSPSTSTHPIFAPVSIHTHAPLCEIDYNLHKSNSTYFSDLDEARTALVTKLLLPALGSGDQTLKKLGHTGRVSVILGAVHCSFHREIRPYERYECRSRVLAWDRKWLVIGTWLLRPGRKGKRGEVQGQEVVLASALSKYVVKKGRFTVKPEHCLRVAGWLPEKPKEVEERERREEEQEQRSKLEGSVVVVSPQGAEQQAESSGGSSEAAPSSTATPAEPVAAAPEDAVGDVAGVVQRVAEKVEVVTADAGIQDDKKDPIAAAAKTPEGGDWEWDWYRVDAERRRGLQLLEHWLALDQTLKDEFS